MSLTADALRRMTPEQRAEFFRLMTDEEAEVLLSTWSFWARPDQLTPESILSGEKSTWLLLAGRGFGKTKVGSQFICEEVEAGRASRIALIAETAADARDVMVEGDSGILACAPRWFRPVYEPSKRRLTWPNGAMAFTYNAVEPDQLRGPQFDSAWGDELAKWRYGQETYDNLMFGLRLSKRPVAVFTTTPRPVKLVREMVNDPSVHVTRGRTLDNADNLPPVFLAQIRRKYEGTRLGRQELDAEILLDTPGALWTRAMLERALKPRVGDTVDLSRYQRIVVSIDPAVSNSEGSDETGIVVAGLLVGGETTDILEDASGRYAPSEWAKTAIELYTRYRADRIVAEVNNGGDLVETTIRAVDPNVAYRAVHASKGKVARAEPVEALYQQDRIKHLGSFPVLEDQMSQFTRDFDKRAMGFSPDRVDALVWAVTELMVTVGDGTAILEFYRRQTRQTDAAHSVPA